MKDYLQYQKQNFAIIILIFSALVFGCTGNPAPPSSTSTPAPVPQSPTPEQKFTFAVWVRDRDTNKLVGQAKVYLAVGAQTIDQKVTDDNGQANFEVSKSFLNTDARFYAEHRNYYPNDITVKLGGDTRHIIMLTDKSVPKIDPDPPKPVTSTDPKTPASTPSKPNMEVIRTGGEVSGTINIDQTKDYLFNADKNNPVLFTARCDTEKKGLYQYYIEIYDSQGKELKRESLYCGDDVKELPFTPPDTGSYSIRIRGKAFYGNFYVFFKSN